MRRVRGRYLDDVAVAWLVVVNLGVFPTYILYDQGEGVRMSSVPVVWQFWPAVVVEVAGMGLRRMLPERGAGACWCTKGRGHS